MSILLEEGVKLINQKVFDKAVTALTTYLNQNPQDVKGWYHRAMAYRALDKHEASLTDLDKALELMPQDPDLLSERGVTKFHLKNIPGALNDMDKAAEVDPKNGYRFSSRAYIKGHLGDTNGAIADYEMAIELDPEDAISYNNLGLLQEEAGRKSASKHQFKKADELAKRLYGDDYKEHNAEPEHSVSIEETASPASQNVASPDTVAKEEIKVSKARFYWSTISGIFTKKEESRAFKAFLLERIGIKKKSD